MDAWWATFGGGSGEATHPRGAVSVQHDVRPFDSAASSSGPQGSPEPDWWSEPLCDPGTPRDDLVQAMPESSQHPEAAGHQAHGGQDAETMEIDPDFHDFLDAMLNPADPPVL